MRKKEKVRIAKNHFATTTSISDITTTTSTKKHNQMMLSAPSLVPVVKETNKDTEKVLCTTTTSTTTTTNTSSTTSTTAPALTSSITFTAPATTTSGVFSFADFVATNRVQPGLLQRLTLPALLPGELNSLNNWIWTHPPVNDAEDKELIIFFQLRLLSHVYSKDCNKSECEVDNCSVLKRFLRHGSTCKKGRMVNGNLVGCSHCLHIWSLLSLHARHCPYNACRVPQCKELKIRNQFGPPRAASTTISSGNNKK